MQLLPYDGVPDDVEVERLRANIPLQEAGRVSERELSMSRANQSVRLGIMWYLPLQGTSQTMKW